MLRSPEHRDLRGDRRLRGGLKSHVEHGPCGVDDREVGCEAHHLGALEDANPAVLLGQVDRACPAAGRQRAVVSNELLLGFVGHSQRRLGACEVIQRSPHVVGVLGADSVERCSVEHLKSTRGAGHGLHLGHHDSLVAGQGVRDGRGTFLEFRSVLRTSAIGCEVSGVHLSAHLDAPSHAVGSRATGPPCSRARATRGTLDGPGKEGYVQRTEAPRHSMSGLVQSSAAPFTLAASRVVCNAGVDRSIRASKDRRTPKSEVRSRQPGALGGVLPLSGEREGRGETGAESDRKRRHCAMVPVSPPAESDAVPICRLAAWPGSHRVARTVTAARRAGALPRLGRWCHWSRAGVPMPLGASDSRIRLATASLSPSLPSALSRRPALDGLTTSPAGQPGASLSPPV